MIKVLHLLASDKYSGAENVVCQIISMFSRDAEYSMAYCSPNGQVKEAVEKRNIRFIPIDRLNRQAVEQVIKEFKPDIIHAHDVKASIVASLCHGDAEVVSMIHSGDSRMSHLGIKSILSLLIVKNVSHIFWVSSASLNEYIFRGIAYKKSSVLYNVIDPQEIMNQINQDGKTYNYDIVFLGRISKEKNPFKLLEVLDYVCKRKKNMKVAIVGTGNLKEQIESLVQEKNLTENIDFLGFQSNPYKILKQSKVMVMTSDWEGTPMCVLEAMALGVPLVSTPVGGIKDLIVQGKNGYLENDSEALARRLIQIIENKELRNRLSENAKMKFNEYNDLSKYKSEIMSAYQIGV